MKLSSGDDDDDAKNPPLPQPNAFILKEIKTKLCVGVGGHCDVISIESVTSAQQEVWILKIGRKNEVDANLSSFSSSSATTLTTTATTDGDDAKEEEDFAEEKSNVLLWKDCLRCGSNRIVLRIWKGGCQWWNLNRNHHCYSLAESEILGYQLAYESFHYCDHRHHKHEKEESSTTTIIIPRILYYSNNKANARTTNDDDGFNKKGFSTTTTTTTIPWAIFEYVGPKSQYFDTQTNIYDSTILNGMVKTRYEFGFEEPHPRWGRVPTDQALDYALMMIDQVIVPLHIQSRRRHLSLMNVSNNNSNSNNSFTHTNIKTYMCMIQLYHKAWKDMMTVISTSSNKFSGDNRMTKAMNLLKMAIEDILPKNQAIIEDIHLLPVLVHLDLQPQNLIFITSNDNNSSRSSSCKTCKVRSVLDWEDAAIADPRFELLLLGRKVCANREQAETIWKAYSNGMKKMATATAKTTNSNEFTTTTTMITATTKTTTTQPPFFSLGPIRPWLQLETIHSITTLLLQSMDLLDGGRNPWETKTDLWDKLQREFQRWEGLCSEEEDSIIVNKT